VSPSHGSFNAAVQKWVAHGRAARGFTAGYAGGQVSRGALVLALRTLIDKHFPTFLPGKDARRWRENHAPSWLFPFDGVEYLFWRCRP
jgi:hypothetical protein